MHTFIFFVINDTMNKISERLCDMKKIDERDTMFARMARIKETQQYQDYYSRNPDLEKADDQLRKLPPMGDESSRFYDPIRSSHIEAGFQFLADIRHLSELLPVTTEKMIGTTKIFTEHIKQIASFYGAKLVGVTTETNHFYSHRGRHDMNYGDKIHEDLPNTIVFAVEMDQSSIQNAPQLQQSVAVVKGYVDAAVIGMILSYSIRALGYQARNHMDGNYLMVLPLAAKNAGLGDIGRNGLLVTKEYGSRIRLGAVTTDLPLNTDSISELCMDEFCLECGLCATYCPAKAISSNTIRSNDKIHWAINDLKCYSKWQEFGTDCGMCVAICPFSLPLTASDVESYIEDPQNATKIIDEYKSNIRKRNQTKTP
jgi:ferredoxin